VQEHASLPYQPPAPPPTTEGTPEVHAPIRPGRR